MGLTALPGETATGARRAAGCRAVVIDARLRDGRQVHPRRTRRPAAEVPSRGRRHPAGPAWLVAAGLPPVLAPQLSLSLVAYLPPWRADLHGGRYAVCRTTSRPARWHVQRIPADIIAVPAFSGESGPPGW